MGRRELRLGPGECSHIETGAKFFAAMAFPAIDDEQAGKKAAAAMVSIWLYNVGRSSTRPFVGPGTGRLRKMGRSWGSAALTTLTRRLQDRTTAARIVRPWIREWAGVPQDLPEGMTKFNLRQMCLFLTDGDVQAANNLQKRVVRPSRPVLHLAAAVDLYDAENGLIERDARMQLDDVDRFAQIVELANRLKGHICSDERYGVAEEDVLELAWIK
jgi:hypothetical protein